MQQQKPSKIHVWNAFAGIIACVIAILGFVGVKTYTDVLGPKWVNQEKEKEAANSSSTVVGVKILSNTNSVTDQTNSNSTGNQSNSILNEVTMNKIPNNRCTFWENCVVMWIESIELNKKVENKTTELNKKVENKTTTLLHLAFEASKKGESTLLASEKGWRSIYLTDSNGNVYDINNRDFYYPNYDKVIKEDEIYRETLEFSELKYLTPQIIIHTTDFSNITIPLNWNK